MTANYRNADTRTINTCNADTRNVDTRNIDTCRIEHRGPEGCVSRACSGESHQLPDDPVRRDLLIYMTLGSVIELGGLPREALALSLAELSQKDASAGVRAALERGAEVAVRLLGTENGFWGDDRVRIPLPQWLEKGERIMKMMGRSKDLEELRLGINRAAEQAVPEAKSLLVNAVKAMSVDDARKILGGGDNAVTQFFAGKTREPLTGKFLPVVTRVTDRIGLARQYNQLAAQVSQFGVVKPEQATIERHVTGKALDGLYFMIGEEEKKIRSNPLGAGSDILKKVFGAVR